MRLGKPKTLSELTNERGNRRGGEHLVERWVRGSAAQIGCFFGLSGLPMAPFYLKIGLDIGCVFAKYTIFNDFVLGGNRFWLFNMVKMGGKQNKNRKFNLYAPKSQ